MPPTVIRLNSPRFRKRIAAFDYDWTLVRPRGRRVFPKNVDDWQWLHPDVPERVRGYYKDGYMVVVITNQSKDWKVDQIQTAMRSLGIPLYVVIARDREEYKPNRILFDAVVPEGKVWDRSASFFVGDAAGRAGDYTDTDRLFAEGLGMRFYVPEDVLLPRSVAPVRSPSPELGAIQRIRPSQVPEVIVMVGMPGSGKSTIAREVFGAAEYTIISGDRYKTPARMIAAANAAIAKGASGAGIVFDATNPSPERRAEFIAFARGHGMPVRCVHVATGFEVSYERNLARPEAARVPRVAYAVYQKRFVEPDEKEGCDVIRV